MRIHDRRGRAAASLTLTVAPTCGRGWRSIVRRRQVCALSCRPGELHVGLAFPTRAPSPTDARAAAPSRRARRRSPPPPMPPPPSPPPPSAPPRTPPPPASAAIAARHRRRRRRRAAKRAAAVAATGPTTAVAAHFAAVAEQYFVDGGNDALLGPWRRACELI